MPSHIRNGVKYEATANNASNVVYKDTTVERALDDVKSNLSQRFLAEDSYSFVQNCATGTTSIDSALIKRGISKLKFVDIGYSVGTTVAIYQLTKSSIGELSVLDETRYSTNISVSVSADKKALTVSNNLGITLAVYCKFA